MGQSIDMFDNNPETLAKTERPIRRIELDFPTPRAMKGISRDDVPWTSA
jgi:hypothetical protein